MSLGHVKARPYSCGMTSRAQRGLDEDQSGLACKAKGGSKGRGREAFVEICVCRAALSKLGVSSLASRGFSNCQ